MTLELPDLEKKHLTPEELRLELACALYARGRLGKVAGAELAGIDFFTFQRALGERQIPTYTVEMLHEDMETLKKLEKDHQISQDDHKRFDNEVQKTTDQSIHDIDVMLAQKEKEIMTV